jgi:hypothetical protein
MAVLDLGDIQGYTVFSGTRCRNMYAHMLAGPCDGNYLRKLNAQ